MDKWIGGVYMLELENQAEAARLAALDFNDALKRSDAEGVPRAFAAMQALLAAAAMISKMLWPSPPAVDEGGQGRAATEHRTRTIDRGRYLRSELSVRGIPVLESRKVRNALEHFDERLDGYFDDGNRYVVDRTIGPRDSAVVIDGSPAKHLRLIDPVAGKIAVLDDEVEFQVLFDAVAEVGRGASAWLQASRAARTSH